MNRRVQTGAFLEKGIERTKREGARAGGESSASRCDKFAVARHLFAQEWWRACVRVRVDLLRLLQEVRRDYARQPPQPRPALRWRIR